MEYKVQNFKAGNIRNYLQNWKKLTSDSNILEIIKSGLKLNFSGVPPENSPFEYPRKGDERKIINVEVQRLLTKEVIELSTTQEKGEYFSNLFTAPKKDGTHRTILNLKFLNKECDTSHFKMESLKQALH